MPSSEVEKPQGQLLKVNKAPAALAAMIDLEAWASAVVRKTPYTEPNPDYIPTMLALETITATSIGEVFQQAHIIGVQELVPNAPNARWGPFEVTDLYVASSGFETGNPSYVILTVMHLETGEETKMTTGATNIQATFIGLLANGMWPIRATFIRGESKDRGGRFLLFLIPPD